MRQMLAINYPASDLLTTPTKLFPQSHATPGGALALPLLRMGFYAFLYNALPIRITFVEEPEPIWSGCI